LDLSLKSQLGVPLFIGGKSHLRSADNAKLKAVISTLAMPRAGGICLIAAG
jgi:hypothetical protein